MCVLFLKWRIKMANNPSWVGVVRHSSWTEANIASLTCNDHYGNTGPAYGSSPSRRPMRRGGVVCMRGETKPKLDILIFNIIILTKTVYENTHIKIFHLCAFEGHNDSKNGGTRDWHEINLKVDIDPKSKMINGNFEPNISASMYAGSCVI